MLCREPEMEDAQDSGRECHLHEFGSLTTKGSSRERGHNHSRQGGHEGYKKGYLVK